MEKRQDSSFEAGIKILKQKYDELADMLIEEKKFKDEIYLKAASGTKSGFLARFYYLKHIYLAIIKKAITKDSI